MIRQVVLYSCFLLSYSIFAQGPSIFLGADLSYINELEDCGGTYYENGVQVDPYELFGNKGANIIRLRLWHTPNWTSLCGDTNVYSTFQDVQVSIGRAKAEGMKILLDFHYSDNWADPGKQLMPVAWQGITDVEILKDSIYAYTYGILNTLGQANLLPEYVQVGNEINNGFVDSTPQTNGMDWPRASSLINEAILAVRNVATEFNTDIGVVLHTAQPDHVSWWFQQATDAGIVDFDIIGMSYYPKWSNYDILGVGSKVAEMRSTYNKMVWIVETAYPWSLQNYDGANNIFGDASATIAGYPATPTGQKNFLIDLTQTLIDSGGSGMIYWEPAWISTSCCTQWEQGSSWENASFFDHGSSPIEALPAFEFFTHPYQISLAYTIERETVPVDVYPNLVTNVIILDAEGVLPAQVEVKVFDVKGTRIMREILPGNFDMKKINTSAWESGWYILQLQLHHGPDFSTAYIRIFKS